MAKLNLEKFKENADKIVQEKSTQGLFSESPSKLIILELDLVYSNKIRVKLNNLQLESLSESIEKFKQVAPIIVRKTDIGYEILDGHARVEAIKSIGGESVLCMQINASKEEADFYPYLLNQTNGLDTFEVAYYLERLQNSGYTAKKIEKSLSLELSEYTAYGFEYNLFDVLKNSDLITYEDLKEISGIENETLRDETLDHLVQKLKTRDEVENYLKKVKEEELGAKFVLRESGVRIRKSNYKVSLDLDERELSYSELQELYSFMKRLKNR